MNGWQRLYIVLLTPAALLLLVLAVVAFPSTSKQHYAYDCRFEASYFTADRARQIVATGGRDEPLRAYPGEIDWPQCLARMEEIATGAALAQDRQEYWSEFWLGALLFSVFGALAYAAGWSVGWVWRGFFPRKAGGGP